MSLSCHCDDFEIDGDSWGYISGEDFSNLQTKRSRKCCSCGDMILPGADVVKFERMRGPRNEIEERCKGAEIYLSDWYMCEECGGLYLSLSELGYCVELGQDDMHDLVKEYAALKAEGRKHVEMAKKAVELP